MFKLFKIIKKWFKKKNSKNTPSQSYLYDKEKELEALEATRAAIIKENSCISQQEVPVVVTYYLYMETTFSSASRTYDDITKKWAVINKSLE